MTEPNDMISNKDILYMADILNVTYTLIKKLRHYDDEIVDKKIKTLNNKIVKDTIKQYDELLGVLS